jgi:hypothetical protein
MRFSFLLSCKPNGYACHLRSAIMSLRYLQRIFPRQCRGVNLTAKVYHNHDVGYSGATGMSRSILNILYCKESLITPSYWPFTKRGFTECIIAIGSAKRGCATRSKRSAAEPLCRLLYVQKPVSAIVFQYVLRPADSDSDAVLLGRIGTAPCRFDSAGYIVGFATTHHILSCVVQAHVTCVR